MTDCVKCYAPISLRDGDDETAHCDHCAHALLTLTQDALIAITSSPCGCLSTKEENWHHETCHVAIARKALADFTS